MICGRAFPAPLPGRRIARGRTAGSIAAVEQAPRDHLGLDFGRALEDREDSRIAQDAQDLVFQRKAVAAMDLHHIGEGKWSDEKVLAKVREMVLPQVERRGAIEAWIIDDTGF